MALDGSCRQAQFFADLGTGQALRDQACDVQLAVGQPSEDALRLFGVRSVAEYAPNIGPQQQHVANAKARRRDPLAVDEGPIGRLEIDKLHCAVARHNELDVLAGQAVVVEGDVAIVSPPHDHGGRSQDHRQATLIKTQIDDRNPDSLRRRRG